MSKSLLEIFAQCTEVRQDASCVDAFKEELLHSSPNSWGPSNCWLCNLILFVLPPPSSFCFRVLLLFLCLFFTDLFTDAAETEKMALSLEDSEGVYFVPSFNGLQVFFNRIDMKGAF